MREQLVRLWRLQVLDQRLSDCRRARAAVQSIIQRLTHAVEEQAEIEAQTKAALRRSQIELSEHETSLASLSERKRVIQNRADNASDPRQQEALQQELADLSAQEEQEESQAFESLSASEAWEEKEKTASKRLAAVREELSTKSASQSVEEAALDAEIAAVQTARAALWAEIDPTFRQGYQRRWDEAHPERFALAVVEDETCDACSAHLSRNIIQHVNSESELVPCPSCDRLLVSASIVAEARETERS